jgi:hypothetical protein
MSFSTPSKTITVEEAWNIGMRRVQKIVDTENALGYTALATGLYSTIPDIIVFDLNINPGLGFKADMVVRVYEVTNYASKAEYIQLARAERYRDTLLKFQAHKIFVCSFEENLRYLTGGKRFFEEHDIEVRFAGNQD